MPNLVFLPWLRRGLAAAIVRPDQQGGSDPRTTFAVGVAVKSGAETLNANVSLPLVGPGDIAGLDPRVVVRTTPLRDDSNAEFKHFVAIEFDQADLPWRYTPAKEVAQRLHPWISLLVLKDDEWEAVAPEPGRKLPVARIINGNALPPIDLSWAWAHVQLHGTAAAGTPAAIEAAVQGQPGQFVARLLSPRFLRPQTRYTALLVPTYERGRRAGLGLPVDDPVADALAYAFTQGVGNVELPVYYQWQFQTGVVGSFKDLAALLKPEKAPPSLGRRNIDVSEPGFQLRSAAASGQTAMPIEGALQSIENAGVTQPLPSADFVSDLSLLVNKSTTFINGEAQILVTPPLYGRWHAPEPELGNTPPNPPNRPWFFQLNSNPLNRVGGGLGTQVVEESQQELMASAWAQFEGLEVVNSERRYMQFGREVLTRLFNRHLKTVIGSPDTFLQKIGGLSRWVLRGAGDITVHAELTQSNVGPDLLEPQWRRFSRPRGLVGRKQLRHLPGAIKLTPFTRLASGFKVAPQPPIPPGMVTPSRVGGSLVPANLSPPRITTLSGQGNDPMLFWGLLLFCVARKFLESGTEGRAWWWIVRVLRFGLGLIRMAAGMNAINLRLALRDGTLTGPMLRGAPKANFTPAVTQLPNPIPPAPVLGGTESSQVAEIRQAWADALDVLTGRVVQPTIRPVMNVPTATTFLANRLHPGVTLTARAAARVAFQNFTWAPVDSLEPVQAAPEFPQPMWVPLRDVSLDWILPGVDQVGTNTVGAVVTNQRFIEAYMVGLNHEMARTLLWNEYPTDQRGSYFRQFWDSRGVPASAGELRDITRLHEWTSTNLGTHSARTTPISLVLLVRAELIRRYPNIVVYALPAPPAGTFPPTTSGTEILPMFSGQLGGDIAFYGFPATVTPSFMFVLQEQPAEPRFGVDEEPPVTEEPAFHDPAAAAHAAALAQALFRRPMRVAIPGALFIPPS
jgi:hypothetical protein